MDLPGPLVSLRDDHLRHTTEAVAVARHSADLAEPLVYAFTPHGCDAVAGGVGLFSTAPVRVFESGQSGTAVVDGRSRRRAAELRRQFAAGKRCRGGSTRFATTTRNRSR